MARLAFHTEQPGCSWRISPHRLTSYILPLSSFPIIRKAKIFRLYTRCFRYIAHLQDTKLLWKNTFTIQINIKNTSFKLDRNKIIITKTVAASLSTVPTMTNSGLVEINA